MPARVYLSLSLLAAAAAGAQEIRRTDHRIDGEPGIRLFVREVLGAATDRALSPVLLLHGARVPSVASFDLPVEGYSLAADLAAAGFAVYLLDLRGYGGSTRPPEMLEPPAAHPPLVRSNVAVRDLDAAVDWVLARRGSTAVDLLGWATGGHWAGYYASLHPEKVDHLVLYNTLAAGSARHPRLGPGSSLEDPERPGRFHRAAFGAYRFSTADSLFGTWDASIPVEDKGSWRDPRVERAYAEAALASDPISATREPASFRAPSGALEDSFHLASGHALWDASLVRASTLLLRSERDFWSRPEDLALLESRLLDARSVRSVVLPDATHWVHLDRPERGRTAFLEAVVAFLSSR